MRFEFNYESFGTFWNSFKSPDKEISVTRRSGSLRLQQRGDTYAMRFGGFGNVSYRDFTLLELRNLQSAIDQLLKP
jgi:hypothetical protein